MYQGLKYEGDIWEEKICTINQNLNQNYEMVRFSTRSKFSYKNSRRDTKIFKFHMELNGLN